MAIKWPRHYKIVNIIFAWEIELMLLNTLHPLIITVGHNLLSSHSCIY